MEQNLSAGPRGPTGTSTLSPPVLTGCRCLAAPRSWTVAGNGEPPRRTPPWADAWILTCRVSSKVSVLRSVCCRPTGAGRRLGLRFGRLSDSSPPTRASSRRVCSSRSRACESDHCCARSGRLRAGRSSPGWVSRSCRTAPSGSWPACPHGLLCAPACRPWTSRRPHVFASRRRRDDRRCRRCRRKRCRRCPPRRPRPQARAG